MNVALLCVGVALIFVGMSGGVVLPYFVCGGVHMSLGVALLCGREHGCGPIVCGRECGCCLNVCGHEWRWVFYFVCV